MTARIIAIISLNLALPLLCGNFYSHAETSGSGGTGDIVPSAVFIHTVGDNKKFAEDHWIRRGISGGVYEYNYIDENEKGDSIVAEARAIAGNNDYLVDLDLKKVDVGELIVEFKQFNKYYDNSGGTSTRITPSPRYDSNHFETDRDLVLNIGNFKIEGIVGKEGETTCAVAYEREYRIGTKSLISWGPVTGNGITRYLLPTFLETNEIVDKIEMKIEHSTDGFDMSIEQVWERVQVENEKVNNRTLTMATGVWSNVRYKREDMQSDLYTTVMRISKELSNKVLFSMACLYNHIRSDINERITDTSVATSNENHPYNPANVENDTVTFLPKLSFSLSEHLLADIGVRYEWTGKNGTANYHRDRTNPPDGNPEELLNIKDEINENKLGETIDLRYDGFKNVALFASGSCAQQIRNDYNTQDSYGPISTPSNNFLRNTDIETYDYEGTIGSKYYPISKVDVTAEYKYKNGIRYLNVKSRHLTTGDITNGYRGYLDSFQVTSHKPFVKLSVHPLKWISCSLRYGFDAMFYGVETRASDTVELSQYLAHTYSGGTTITPCESLNLSCFYQYREAATNTPANGSAGPGANLPTYDANVKTLIASFSYTLRKDATLTGSYSFSRANNFNDYSSTGIPLGIDNFSQDASLGFEKRIASDLSLEVRYGLAQYHEPSNGGIDDYVAHLFNLALKGKF